MAFWAALPMSCPLRPCLRYRQARRGHGRHHGPAASRVVSQNPTGLVCTRCHGPGAFAPKFGDVYRSATLPPLRLAVRGRGYQGSAVSTICRRRDRAAVRSSAVVEAHRPWDLAGAAQRTAGGVPAIAGPVLSVHRSRWIAMISAMGPSRRCRRPTRLLCLRCGTAPRHGPVMHSWTVAPWRGL